MSSIEALTTQIGTLSPGALQDVGDTFTTRGGRTYKYVKFTNTSALAAGAHVYGVVTTGSALAVPTQNALNLVPGSTQLVVTVTGATTAGVYAGGYALITSGSNLYSVRVANNSGSAGAGTILLTFDEGLPMQGDAVVPGTTTVTLSTCPDNASTTTATGNVNLGLTVTAVPAQTSGNAVYGYTQIGGYSAVGAAVLEDQ